MDKRRAYAKRMNAMISVARELVDDKTASLAPELYGRLREVDASQEAPLVKAGPRINWKGSLKRAAVDLWDTPENNPDNAPTLWENIEYKLGVRIIPETLTAGLAFAKDEEGWWKDKKYISLIDANVWTPETYPTGWKIVEE